jgi:hypothetical protein
MMQTHDELKEAYEAYFALRMKDPQFGQFVHELGQYGLANLHNMLFTFFQAGATATGAH